MYETQVLGPGITVVVVVGTWIVCGLVNWLLFLWFSRQFVTREEYRELKDALEDGRHRDNLVVQGRILSELQTVRRAAGIPEPRRPAPDPPKQP